METTSDRMLGGRIVLRQPRAGYRAGGDPVLLAAAVPATSRRVVDLGCGAGAAMLCLAARLAGATITGIERDPAMTELARANIATNGFGERCAVVEADIARPPRALRAASFDAAMLNPPFHAPARSTPSAHAGRAAARHEGEAKLAGWIDAALRLVRVKGHILAIQRADRLGELLQALSGHAGAIEIIPLWPRAGEKAKGVIVRAIRGARAPMTLAPGLIVHDGRSYSAAAEAILRDAGAL